MAVWLAEQVGESGEVVATDIDVTYLKQLNLPNLEVRQHNILNDPLDALGPGSFDLVCSRLLLFWLAGKQEAAIRRMVECLRPGGWLVDEDGDGVWFHPYIFSDRSTPSTMPCGKVATGGHLGGTIPSLDASCRCYSSVAVWRTFGMRRMLRSYVALVRGLGGGGRP